MPAGSLRALLADSIDYAGMFPPCNLALDLALQNQANYVLSTDAWMLGAFILPVAQFEAAVGHISRFDHNHPLRVSALGTKTENAAEFLKTLTAMIRAMRSFASRNRERVSLSQIEMPLPARAGLALDVELDTLNEARSAMGDLELPTFWEAPPEAAERVIALISKHNSGTGSRPFGYKLRTGGVTVDAFPTSAQIARVIVTSAKQRVPIKFTAGLHHPIRQFRDEVKTKMHGFLNVLGAAVLAAEHDWNEQQTTAMLEDENAKSFLFDEDSFAWREWTIDTDCIAERRKMVTSFGSCSFDEPREDLRALNFL